MTKHPSTRLSLKARERIALVSAHVLAVLLFAGVFYVLAAHDRGWPISVQAVCIVGTMVALAAYPTCTAIGRYIPLGPDPDPRFGWGGEIR